MRKRLLCTVLTIILLFSAQPTAAASTGNTRSTNITASCRLPIIRVSVPTKATVYINPLKLPVSIGREEEELGQIISTPACLVNKSEVPLVVDVTVLGGIKSGSDMTLAASSTKGSSSTSKSAFVYFEIQKSDSEDPDDVQWDAGYDSAKHIAIVDSVPITKKSVVTLAERTLDGEVAEGGYAPFRLTGDAVEQPTVLWNTKDGLQVLVAFTFTPLPYEE